MAIHQISVFVENKPGKLVGIIEELAAQNINIRASSIADTTDFGIFRLITNDFDKRRAVQGSRHPLFGGYQHRVYVRVHRVRDLRRVCSVQS